MPGITTYRVTAERRRPAWRNDLLAGSASIPRKAFTMQFMFRKVEPGRALGRAIDRQSHESIQRSPLAIQCENDVALFPTPDTARMLEQHDPCTG
jgi:hypothetical protein